MMTEIDYLSIAAIIGIIVYWLIGKNNTLKIILIFAFFVNIYFLLN